MTGDCGYCENWRRNGKHLRGCIDHPDPASRRVGPWTEDNQHHKGE